MTLKEFNELSSWDASEAFYRCCSAPNWAADMMKSRPFESMESLNARAQELWKQSSHKDVMAAFAGHPKIGDRKNLEKKFKDTASWAGEEQGSVRKAHADTLNKLAQENEAYEEKFGYIFIVCATGKSAEEMLHLLEARLVNRPDQEYEIAKVEQSKITKLRLHKLIS